MALAHASPETGSAASGRNVMNAVRTTSLRERARVLQGDLSRTARAADGRKTWSGPAAISRLGGIMLGIGSKSNAVKKCLFIGLLGCALCAPASALAQGPIIGIVVFGDSLSDPGNAFALVGGTNTPPDYSVDFFLVPDQPYARGGHHFTNGATWIEQLAQSEGLAANAQPAFRGSSAGATNYAVGSARARDDGSQINLTHQVDRFLQDFSGAAPGDALYVIEIIGNDIRDVAATQDPSIIASALSAIQTNI